jgi:hypothetical protein
MRIVVGVISAVITLVMAVLGGLVLLLALNGFSEGQAGPGLSVYPVVALASVILSVVVGMKSYSRFMASGKWSPGLAGLVAVVIAAVLSAVVLGIAFVVSIVITNAM